MKNNSRGFTLLELMVVVMVVAILASIAYPSYQRFIMQSRRSDALQGLLSAQLQQEQYRVRTGKYAGNGQGSLIGLTNTSYYNFSVVSAAGSGGVPTYTLTATAVSSQLNDTDCRTLSINNTDLKTSSSSSGTASTGCWN
ncbi:MAG: type IV pilin protein [Tolumonas sp.]|nr:type IV pilin protein [Tolumonas sp.]